MWCKTVTSVSYTNLDVYNRQQTVNLKIHDNNTANLIYREIDINQKKPPHTLHSPSKAQYEERYEYASRTLTVAVARYFGYVDGLRRGMFFLAYVCLLYTSHSTSCFANV